MLHEGDFSVNKRPCSFLLEALEFKGILFKCDFCCQDIILFIIKIPAEIQMVLKLNCVHHFDCNCKLSLYWDLTLKRFTGIYRLNKTLLSITHLVAYFVLKT